MNTIKLVAVSALALSLLILVTYFGLQSKKIKELAAKLLKVKADLELDKIKVKRDNQKEKVRKLSEKATQKRATYRNYIKSLNSKN